MLTFKDGVTRCLCRQHTRCPLLEKELDMIASAIIQTALLLSSGGFNVLLSPGNLSVENQLFVSSVILMIGFSQGFVLVILKVVLRWLTGFDIKCGMSYLFAPLTKAMSNAVNDRPGETDVLTPIVTKIPPRKSTDAPEIDGSIFDGFDSEDDAASAVASHFMPELEIEITERRNVYTDVYLLGIATFTVTYCIDTVSPVPTTAFLSGLLIMSIAQSANIIVILSRATDLGLDTSLTRAMRGKRLLTFTACIFSTGAFVMFCVGLANVHTDASDVSNMFDVTFSVLLPLIAPWLLVTVSPKQQPLRTLFEATPFVFTISVSFVLFFLATRGQISTIVHDINLASTHNHDNATNAIVSNKIIDVEFHSGANASMHFNMDIFSTTSVDSTGNIPMLLAAPIIKIPTIVVVLANIINRSNLVVITTLLVTMSAREIAYTDPHLSEHHAYCISLALGCVALLCNVIKYIRIPDWLFKIGHKNASDRAASEQDMNLSLNSFS
jgi:hypothetical protein